MYLAMYPAVYPAMERAYEFLQQTTAKIKQVIILTDGNSSPGDLLGLAATMASSRITISTVAIGVDSDSSLLEDIARVGQGRYYMSATILVKTLLRSRSSSPRRASPPAKRPTHCPPPPGERRSGRSRDTTEMFGLPLRSCLKV